MTTRTRAAFARIVGVADEPAIRRATTLVTVVLVLLAISEAGYGAANEAGEAPMVLALFILPLLYVAPASRPWWLRYRYPLLAVQAVLTCLALVLFGASWISGPSGWLGGLVLLTVPSPASWIVATALAGAELAVRAGVVGLPYEPAASSALLVLTYCVLNALILFGLARLADLIAAVHAARDELAEAAVGAERIRAADSLRAAIGGRLTAAAGRAAAALQAMAGSPARAREHIAETGIAARQALAEVREVAVRYRDEARPEVTAVETGKPLAPRLAQAILAALLCGLAVLYVLLVAGNVNRTSNSSGYGAAAVGWTIADAVAVVALQLRHSWPSRGIARPRGWPATLALQALLTYALVPVTGWHPLVMAGFLAGSVLLLIPTAIGQAAFAAVVLSLSVLWAVKPPPDLTTLQWAGGLIFLTLDSAALGLLVYALTRLAQLAVQLEDLRGELARKAVVGERLRMARDTHDLLGLGLSAIAMKADLIGKLIGRDDTRAGAEIAELARICATARADIRLVTGEARDLPLGAELAAARDVLASAGIEVRAHVSPDPSPSLEAAAVLVPVVREAVTNILKHSSASYCVLEMTADAGLLRLLISNDGSKDDEGALPLSASCAGNGLRNLAARLEEAGGRLIAGREGGTFSLAVEVPLPALAS